MPDVLVEKILREVKFSIGVNVIIDTVTPVLEQRQRAIVFFIVVSLHVNEQNDSFLAVPSTAFLILLLYLVHNKLDEAQMLLIIDVVGFNY